MRRTVLGLAIGLVCGCSSPPARPDGGACVEPESIHCCCFGDLVDEPMCGDSDRWTCGGGWTYYTGASCRPDTIDGPCTAPSAPDSGPAR